MEDFLGSILARGRLQTGEHLQMLFFEYSQVLEPWWVNASGGDKAAAIDRARDQPAGAASNLL
jgi:hypothetical protein